MGLQMEEVKKRWDKNKEKRKENAVAETIKKRTRR
jgi:hypothetical protein